MPFPHFIIIFLLNIRILPLYLFYWLILISSPQNLNLELIASMALPLVKINQNPELFYTFPTPEISIYSYLNESAGLARAAIYARRPTVNIAISKAIREAMRKDKMPGLTL